MSVNECSFWNYSHLDARKLTYITPFAYFCTY
jgi:hypothetical protein